MLDNFIPSSITCVKFTTKTTFLEQND